MQEMIDKDDIEEIENIKNENYLPHTMINQFSLYKEDEGYDPQCFHKNLLMPQKTSKMILNNNARKFKLTRLKQPITIRYEVIYKNSLRDLRKFFTHDMYNVTDYIRRKKKE